MPDPSGLQHKPRVPVPLHATQGVISHEEMTDRYSHNLINEAIHANDEIARRTLSWYRSGCSSIAEPPNERTRDALELTLPLAGVRATLDGSNERMPPVITFSEPPFTKLDPHFKAESRVVLDVKLDSPKMHNLMATTMTPHTTMMVFKDTGDRHYVCMGYTLPKRIGEEREIGAQLLDPPPCQVGAAVEHAMSSKKEKKAREKELGGQRTELRVRLSKTAYRMDARCQEATAVHSCHSGEIFRPDAASKFRIARCDGFLLTEEAISLLLDMPAPQKEALCDPLRACLWLESDRCYIEHRQFEAAIADYLVSPLAPQQLHFCYRFLMLVIERCAEPGTPYTLLPLGGPPGTGKTGTLIQAIILVRCKKVVARVLSLLQAKGNYTLWADSDLADQLVAGVVAHRICYVAPTNDACDEATSQSDAARTVLRQRGVLGDIAFTPLRVSKMEKACLKPDLLHLHVLYAAAQFYLENIEASISMKTRDMDANVYPGSLREFTQLGKSLQEALQKLPEESIEREDISRQLEDLDAALGERTAALKEYTATDQLLKGQRDRLEDTERRVRRFLDKPWEYGAHSLKGKAKAGNRDLERRYLQLVPSIIEDSHVVCFLTAGFVNPYNKHAQEVATNAIVACDEFTQMGFADTTRIMRNSTDLVLCGDKHQLSARVDGDERGTPDLRRSLMSLVNDGTTWLDLCFRMPPVSTAFHNMGNYAETGLYAPTAQNLVRSSPLHSRQLFAPMVRLTVAGEMMVEEEGGSRFNMLEAVAVREFLREFIAASKGMPPIKLRIMSPYTAQVKVLERHCRMVEMSPCFSEVRIGTVETSQGSTTDLAICSLATTDRVGFLTDERLTVATSRHRLHLVVIGNFPLLGSDQHAVLPRIISSPAFTDIYLGSSEKEVSEACAAAARVMTEEWHNGLLQAAPCTAPQHSDPWMRKGEAASFKAMERVGDVLERFQTYRSGGAGTEGAADQGALAAMTLDSESEDEISLE